uniref:Uncharacterized protein n=1 Tax=Panagrolaimus davidi TaxID=227884 RepID=A0A914PJA2_9BILA
MPPLPTLPTSAPITSSITYKVAAQRVSNQPILSKDMGSFWDFNYNAALFQKDNEIGMIVQVQNLKDENIPYEVGPSYLTLTNITFKNGQVYATPTTNKTMNLLLHTSPACGIKDPRIAFMEGSNSSSNLRYDASYNLFFTSNECQKTTLSAASTFKPFDSNGWSEIESNVLPLRSSSKSGAPLYASDENKLKHDYLFWGDSISPPGGIGIALGQRGHVGFEDFDSYLFKTREDYFDSERIEAGPSPLKLNTGDYLFLYNGARKGFHSVKPNWSMQFNLGYTILAGSDPTQVLDRSEYPLMTPTLDWEIGNSPKYLTPNVVFIGGLIPDPNGCQYVNVTDLLGSEYIDNAECFFGVYNAADSHLGAVRIVVSSDANITHPSTTLASTTTTAKTPIIVSTSTVRESSVSITSTTPPPPTTTTTSDANTKVLSFIVVVIVGILSI